MCVRGVEMGYVGGGKELGCVGALGGVKRWVVWGHWGGG